MNEEKDIRTLSAPESGTEKKKLGMVKKQKVMIIVFLSLFAVLMIVYFAVIKPIYDDRSEPTTEESPELIDGEALTDSGNGILIFPHIEMKEIKSIAVSNGYGKYTFVNGGTTQFYLEENMQAPINADMSTAFAVAAGYTTIERRVTENCEDFSLYGLADDQDPAFYTLTAKDGSTHTIYIGDEVPGNSGYYYCRYAGRNVVYTAGASFASTVLSPATALISPSITYPIDQNNTYLIDNFIIRKNGESFLYIKCDQEKIDKVNNSEDVTYVSVYNMLYPGSKYIVNDDLYQNEVLGIFDNFTGEGVVAAGSPDDPLIFNEEQMEKYGFSDLENVPFEIMFDYKKVLDDKTEEDATAIVMLAPAGVDGYYYAYSYEYDTISLVSKDAIPFLDWGLLKFVNESIYEESIDKVANVTVKADLLYDSDGTGSKTYKIDESFDIKYVQKSDTITELECYAHSTGKTITGTKTGNNPVQAFYGSLVGVYVRGYVSEDGIDPSELDEYACITVTYNDGKQTVYRFYRYGNKCAYSVDGGDAELYVTKSGLDKVIIDAVNAAWNEDVRNSGENPVLNDKYLAKYAENND